MGNESFDDCIAESSDTNHTEEQQFDDDYVLQRYNSQLPPAYRSSLDVERTLLIRALRTLANSILTSTEAVGINSSTLSSDSSEHHLLNPPTHPHDDDSVIVTESYQHDIERDLGAFEKGITRFIDLKHPLDQRDYPVFVNLALRSSLSPTIDMGLRIKMARCCSRLLSKRQCVLPAGIPWRPILNQIIRFHIDCIDGAQFIGGDIKDSHCRAFLCLLDRARNFLSPDDSAEKIWNHFSPHLRSCDIDIRFKHLLMLSHVLPTRFTSWSGWIPEGMTVWKSLHSSSDWDNIWFTLLGRMFRNQPCIEDLTPHLPWIYNRITPAFRLPLGSLAPQSPMDRRCPHPYYFLVGSKPIAMIAVLIVYSLSPKYPEALQYLQRLFAFIANYFHPSNYGRWSGCLGNFLVNITNSLAARVTEERRATKAGIMDRVIGHNTQRAIAPGEHRLTDEVVHTLVDMILPLLQQGMHSKIPMLSLRAASAARDLAIIFPNRVIEPLLVLASDGLACVSTPHRTTSALKLLAALSPVFLDMDIFPSGGDYLPQALQLTLPGIDPNDPGKTEATLRFISGAAARLQSTVASDSGVGIFDFLEDYIRELLDRIFILLDSLEAPPKKNRNGMYPFGGGPQLSFFVFSMAIENVFAAVPAKVALAGAQRIARQLTSCSCKNAMKYYGVLVRTAAAAAAAIGNGSSVSIFVPLLINQILEDDDTSTNRVKFALVSVGEEELVWRIRMLAQACRCCGSGIEPYLEKVSIIIRLAFDKPSRPIYKAGGRLLRGVLEGLTSIQMMFGAGQGTEVDSTEDGSIYKFEWNVPSPSEWKHAEDLLMLFVERAEELCKANGGSTTTSEMTSDRDILFRALRLLHAIQRGGRWLLGGAFPMVWKDLSKFSNGDVNMSKEEAKLVLKRPILAGLGGEFSRPGGEEFATKVWRRVYSLISKIIEHVVATRPDDGALLYRCLEPIELAHEPFRKGERSRQTLRASRTYKGTYKPIIASKRPFNSKGGVGRAMPRFIIKLRIESHHEMRLSIAARCGMGAEDICEKLMNHMTTFVVNDFPRVRTESRGVFTRALRIVRPNIRKRQICKVIDILRTSIIPAIKSSGNSEKKKNDSTRDENPIVNEEEGQESLTLEKNMKTSSKDKDILYEKMLGSASVLRSAAVTPVVMRDWGLFIEMMKALLDVIPKAERADGAHLVHALLVKLSGMIRPLGIEPVRLVKSDFVSFPSMEYSRTEEEGRCQRLQQYEDLNSHLLSVLQKTSMSSEKVQNDLKTSKDVIMTSSEPHDAHWRLQVLVATILYVTLREDRPPPVSVINFFVRGVASDVVTLRQISGKALMFLLAMHGRKAGVDHSTGLGFDDSPAAWASIGNEAMSSMATVVTSKEYVRALVHTLALDHEDGSESNGSTRFGMISGNIGSIIVLNLSRCLDGDTSWTLTGGRPWPSSWIPRSADNLNIVRMRLYEAMVRVFGKQFFDVMLPTLRELIHKLQKKQERIICGVKDEDVKVIAGEVIAAMCRGLNLVHCENNNVQGVLEELAIELLNEYTGTMGYINGGSLIRLICTSETFAVGFRVQGAILKWLLHEKPLIVAMGDGPVAHLQARKLRFLHSCLADVEQENDERMAFFAKEAILPLMSEVGFDHEMKTVREEVAKCLSLLSGNVPSQCQGLFSEGVKLLFGRLECVEENFNDEDTTMTTVSESGEKMDLKKKSRSRQGETLSRYVSILLWNGRAKNFEVHVPEMLPALFASFDESDPERISHARIALSFTAQGTFSQDIIDDIISSVEKMSKDSRWKVRVAVLGFLQVFSFMSLFTGRLSSLHNIRGIVVNMLFDVQLEVRQCAAAALVTMIRDASTQAVEEVREEFVKVLRKTTQKRRVGKRIPLDAALIRKRHGAVLGLSSMVICNPYTVPKWLPRVLVELSGCVNDPPPVSTGVRKLFADFMRTHRDEWQMHKLAFTPDELDIVSELMISPSYYA